MAAVAGNQNLLVFGMEPTGKYFSDEHIAINQIVELAKIGLLDRVRKCGCGQWFFARFSHQESHNAACRVEKFRSSEAFKAKRREYMRENYRLKMSGKVK